MKILVIVESPAKAKTIQSYLSKIDGKNTYIVKASFGHIRDLDGKDLSIDLDHHYVCKYVVLGTKAKVIQELQKELKGVGKVYLATDMDREGESISWHLHEHLLKNKGSSITVKRITFNEITPSALKAAIDNPRDLDYHLIEAQQTRRVIDRLVGYKISPLLWKSFDTRFQIKLSAGRVQTAILHLIAEHNNSIDRFESTSYWVAKGSFVVDDKFEFVDAKLHNANGLVKFNQLELIERFLKGLHNKFSIRAIKYSNVREKPDRPYITSSLQQDSYNKLGFTTKMTMKLAQDLYEKGLITYMRTDSCVLSKDAHDQIRSFIVKTFGNDMYEQRTFTNKQKHAQEAHEAIRPTNMNQDHVGKLSAQHKMLYELIRKRAISSQMVDAVFKECTVSIIDASFPQEYEFHGKHRCLIEPGWKVVYGMKPELSISVTGTSITCREIVGHNIWTSPPAHFNESSLVKLLEKEGIGRPSTYASSIDKLYEKQYVIKQDCPGKEYKTIELTWKQKKLTRVQGQYIQHLDKNAIVLTDIGRAIHEFMKMHFSDLIDKEFTKNMEDKLDDVAQGNQNYEQTVDAFWKALEQRIQTHQMTRSKTDKKQSLTTTNKIFEIDGEMYKVRLAKFGPVIEYGDKKFIDLRAYLKLVRKGYMDLQKEDVEFVSKLPISVFGATLLLGRYGLYLKFKDGFTAALNAFWLKKHYPIIHNVVNLTTNEIEQLRNGKEAYLNNKNDKVAPERKSAKKRTQQRSRSSPCASTK